MFKVVVNLEFNESIESDIRNFRFMLKSFFININFNDCNER